MQLNLNSAALSKVYQKAMYEILFSRAWVYPAGICFECRQDDFMEQ